MTSHSDMKAFPQKYPKDPLSVCTQLNPVETGMDLRDYFAAKAMQAIIGKADDRSTTIEEVELWIGHYAYKVADAMIESKNLKEKK